MFKSIVKLEHKIGDRVYSFVCDNDSPLGEAHDALAKFKAHVVDLINKAEPAKPQDSTDQKTE
jgi:hypothetical protein